MHTEKMEGRRNRINDKIEGCRKEERRRTWNGKERKRKEGM